MKKLVLLTFCTTLIVHATLTSDSVQATSSPAMSGTFTMYASSSLGASNVGIMILRPMSSASPPYSSNYTCDVEFDAVNHWVYVRPDLDGPMLHGINYGLPGENYILSNSQCSVPLTGFSYGYSANQVWFSAPITYAPSYTGAKYLWTFVNPANGSSENPTAWLSKGIFTVGTSSLPSTYLISPPSGGTGAYQAFSFGASSPAGYADIASSWHLFSPNGGYAGTCGVMFVPGSNCIKIINDQGTDWGTCVTIGSSTVLENSQCTISAASASMSRSGDNNTYSWLAVFKPSFSGTKTMLGLSANQAVQYNPPYNLGSWSVPVVSVDISSNAINEHIMLNDDNTGQTVERPTSISPWIVKLKNGRRVKIAHAGGFEIDNPQYSNEPVGDSYIYHFSVDTRPIWGFRLGDDEDMFWSDTVGLLQKTEGWNGGAFGWSAPPETKRSASTEFSLTSKWRPGPLSMYLADFNLMNPLSLSNDERENELISSVAGIFNNSVRKVVIGPAIKPDITRAELDSLIGRWVKDYGFSFLRPLLDGGTLADVKPAGAFESEILDCLRQAGHDGN